MDFWNMLFLIAAGQGIFLSLMLFISKGSNSAANNLLGFFLFLFSLNLLENVAYWTGYQFEIPQVIGSTRGFVFLFGPILWLYTRRLLSTSYKFQWLDSLHFLVFAIYTIYRLDFYMLDVETKLDLIQSHVPNPLIYRTVEAIICLHMAGYAFYIFRQIQAARLKADPYVVRIVQSLFIGFAVFTLSTVLYYVLVETIDFKPEHDYFISLAGSIAIYQVGYFAFMHPEVLHGFIRREATTSKYIKSPITKENAEQYIHAIKKLFAVDKLYLSNDLRLSDLAAKLGISPNYVSQVINEHFGKTFYELISEYRVEEAKRKLENPDNNDKLLTIALESGFNNRTSFNLLFKKHTGLSPKEYKAQTQVSVPN